MVDTQVLGTCGCKAVGVQVPSPALNIVFSTLSCNNYFMRKILIVLTVLLFVVSLFLIIKRPDRGEIRSRAAQVPTIAPTAVPLAEDSATVLQFGFALHGIGNSGDQRNAKDSSLSNKNPRNLQRQIQVFLSTFEGTPVLATTMPVTYDIETGTFRGKLLLGHEVASGKYTVKVKTAGYLPKVLATAITITQKQETVVPVTELTAGDVNDDDRLNVSDYNVFLDCGYGSINPQPINDPQSAFNSAKCKSHKNTHNVDIDDNSFIDAKDYNLYLREL